MTASPAAESPTRDGYISLSDIQRLLEKSGEVNRTDASHLWRFFTQIARRAQLPYVVDCQACGPVQLTSPCRDQIIRHHVVTCVHAGSIVRNHMRFINKHFVGIGPKLRLLMARLVETLRTEEGMDVEA